MKFQRADGHAGPWSPFDHLGDGIYQASTPRQVETAVVYLKEGIVTELTPAKKRARPKSKPTETLETEDTGTAD